MKSPKFFGKPKKPKRQWLMVRRVVGDSMSPTLAPDRIVVAIGQFVALYKGDIVIVQHDGLEKIKRIQEIRKGQVYLLGDNPEQSIDSRSFGWLPISVVQAKVVWPRNHLSLQ